MTQRPKNGAIEYRYARNSGAPTEEDGVLSGRAAPFNTVTMIGKKPWGFREQIAPGAFAKSINDGDVVLLDNHQSHKPIARQSAGTLKLMEGKNGLDWSARAANTSYANDLRENAKAGNFGGCSFGFEVIKDEWHYNKEDDVDERTLHEVKLHEISVVTFPAYTEGTSVSARDQVKAAKEARKRYYMREYLDLYVVNGVEDEERGGNAPGNGSKPYGNVTYADPGYQKDGKKRYPIDTKQHCKAAWSYINKASNASSYSSSQLASIKNKIKNACKKFGVNISGASAKPAGASASGKNSADLDMDQRQVVDNAMKTSKVATKNAAKAVKGTKNLERDIIKVCLDTSISNDDIRANVLAILASSKIVKLANISKRLNKVGNSVQTDTDGDDPICTACNGSGKLNDGSGLSDCPGCGGVGRHPGGGDQTGNPGHYGGAVGDGGQAAKPTPGDSKGPHKGSSFGLGIDGNGGKQNINNVAGGNPGDGNNLNLGVPGSNQGPQVGTGTSDLGSMGPGPKLPGQLNSADDSEMEKRGQPDTSTDPSDDDDATRYLRMVARKRRMQSESE